MDTVTTTSIQCCIGDANLEREKGAGGRGGGGRGAREKIIISQRVLLST